MRKIHIVIIGGGFGGIYTARYLEPMVRSGKMEISIINRTNYFLFTPLLHEVATGGLSATSVIEPIREIFNHKNIKLIQDEVRTIDPILKKVETINDSIEYDYLVMSSGSETNYYGISGAKENSFLLKDLGDAIKLRRRLLDYKNTCVVVGAGPTGVELSAEISEFIPGIKVTLVAASPDVLPQFPIELRKIAKDILVKKGIDVMTNETVTEVRPGKIIFSDKSFIEAETICWVAGVKPSIIEIKGTEKEKSGRIKIDEYLRVVGHNNIFSLGDVSGTAPMLAQVAVQQSRVVADNIIASISNRSLTSFQFKEKGLLVSLGNWNATGKIFGIVMKGPLMWWIWRTVYLFNFHSWKKRFRIAGEWTINLFCKRNCNRDFI